MAAAAAGTAFLWLVTALVMDYQSTPSSLARRLKSLSSALGGRCENTADRYLRSPLLLPILACSRCLPARFGQFSAYGKKALLLKQSANEVEFVHRLLRDHFALRELRPGLRQQEVDRRVEAIRNLAYQGDAAVETLGDLLTADPDATIREEAALSLGRIASPDVIPRLQPGLADRDPRVRRATVLSVRNRSLLDAERFVLGGIGDPDQSVRTAAIEVAFGFQQIARTVREFHLRRGDLPLIAHLLETSTQEQVVSSAVLAIEYVGRGQVEELLIHALQHGGAMARTSAARALLTHGTGVAVAALAQALSDREKSVRGAAISTLRGMNTPEAEAALADAPRFRRRRRWIPWFPWRRTPRSIDPPGGRRVRKIVP
jgi:HEAT repeat protein